MTSSWLCLLALGSCALGGRGAEREGVREGVREAQVQFAARLQAAAGEREGVREGVREAQVQFAARLQAAAGEREGVREGVREAQVQFAARLQAAAGEHFAQHYALAPRDLWLQLAALAAGCGGAARGELRRALALPARAGEWGEYCAGARRGERAGEARRLLVLDDGLRVNETWAAGVRAAGLADVLRAPLRRAPLEAAEALGAALGAALGGLDLSGDALLLGARQASLAAALRGATLGPEAPFYDAAGREAGRVRYLTLRARAPLVRPPGARGALLPAGEGRALLLVAPRGGLPELAGALPSWLGGALEAALLAPPPRAARRVQLPRFALTVQHDNLRLLLRRLGVARVWRAGAEFVSSPPARPSACVQRAAVEFDAPPAPAPAGPALEGEEEGGEEEEEALVLDRPFLFFLVQRESRAVLLGGAYSRPAAGDGPQAGDELDDDVSADLL